MENALHYFSLASLHVLLAALWGEVDETQITIEDWNLPSGRWKAYLGNYIPRVSGEQPIQIPLDAFDALEAAIAREDLGRGVHWIRTFYCNLGNRETVVEALLDNEVWDAGVRSWSEVAWPQSEDFYSVRHFFMLLERS